MTRQSRSVPLCWLPARSINQPSSDVSRSSALVLFYPGRSLFLRVYSYKKIQIYVYNKTTGRRKKKETKKQTEYLTRVIVRGSSGYGENVFHSSFIKRNSECIGRETEDGFRSRSIEKICVTAFDTLHIFSSFWSIEQNSAGSWCFKLSSRSVILISIRSREKDRIWRRTNQKINEDLHLSFVQLYLIIREDILLHYPSLNRRCKFLC